MPELPKVGPSRDQQAPRSISYSGGSRVAPRIWLYNRYYKSRSLVLR